ncbi:protein DpdG [Aquabacterium lacunae]|uniref:protein DpdG n=1 Tax=Aquabacterium lacunae TaxID=2528630 RepID=UPI00247A6AD3|nr:protein DpdG [Aquabacterium lacunae]
MSIVTNFQAVPNRLFCIFAAVAESENGLLRDQLESWATPPSLSRRGANDEDGGTTELFSNSLAEARRLGLIEDDGERLRVPLRADTSARRKSDLEADFLSRVREVIFDPQRAAAAGQAGVLYALAWFLTKNPLQPVSFSDAPQEQLRKDLGEFAAKADLGSTSSFQNLLYWARYLGFATVAGDGGTRRAFPDPTRAIGTVLDQILVINEWIEIDVFLSRLAGIYPVLEGGVVREELESMRSAPPATDDRLSIASSLALQRLVDRGSILLDTLADAKKARILDFGSTTKRVSHVQIGATK